MTVNTKKIPRPMTRSAKLIGININRSIIRKRLFDVDDKHAQRGRPAFSQKKRRIPPGNVCHQINSAVQAPTSNPIRIVVIVSSILKRDSLLSNMMNATEMMMPRIRPK